MDERLLKKVKYFIFPRLERNMFKDRQFIISETYKLRKNSAIRKYWHQQVLWNNNSNNNKRSSEKSMGTSKNDNFSAKIVFPCHLYIVVKAN